MRHLQHRFATEPAFQAVSQQTQIVHGPVEEVSGERRFGVLISGLPLNNFGVDEVERILSLFERLIAPGGTLSFFEYIFIRRVKALVTSGAGRAAAGHRQCDSKNIGRPRDQMRLGLAECSAGLGPSCPNWVIIFVLGH